ncbi:MAG: tetratricopeptide repeat protein, partial [Desulfobacterales bacterium]
KGQFEQAAGRFLQAERIDPDYAELQFRMGRCYWALGRFAQAKDRYVKARELDTLRFRADTRINGIIRRVAEGRPDQGIHLVDSLQLIEANSPNATPGKELFYEHVHLNFRGNYLVARAIFQQVQKVVPEWVIRQASGRPILTEQGCARRLAYTGWDRLMIAEKLVKQMRKPPFTNQLGNTEAVGKLKQEADMLKFRYARRENQQEVVAQYKAALEDDSAHWSLHDGYAEFLLDGLQNPQEAEKHWRLAIRQCPQSAVELSRLAKALVSQGKHAEAETYYRRALIYDPRSTTRLSNLGIALLRQGRRDQGIRYLEEAIEIDPLNAMAHSNLGVGLAQTDDPAFHQQALLHLEKAIDINPDLIRARENLATYCTKEAMRQVADGEKGHARELLEKAVGLMPDAVSALHNLAVLLNEEGAQEGAIEHLSRILQIDPENRKAREGLASIYFEQGTTHAQKGNLQQAREKLKQTVVLVPGWAQAHFVLSSIHHQLGDDEGSLRHLKQTVRIDPNHEKAQEILRRTGEVW